MAFSIELAEDVREILAGRVAFDELRMFGGLAFMVNTHMACGIIGDDLMVRVGAEGHDEAIASGAREMDFTGRPMRGMIVVPAAGLTEERLRAWVDRAIDHASRLPPKPPKVNKAGKAPEPGKAPRPGRSGASRTALPADGASAP